MENRELFNIRLHLFVQGHFHFISYNVKIFFLLNLSKMSHVKFGTLHCLAFFAFKWPTKLLGISIKIILSKIKECNF